MTPFVEFMGLPASGKSTLSEAMLAALRRRVPAALAKAPALKRALRQRDDGCFKNALKALLPEATWKGMFGVQYALPEWHAFAARHAGLCACVFDYAVRADMPEAWRSSVLYAFLRTACEHQILCASREPVPCIIDEGLAQRAFTIFGYVPGAAPRDTINRYVREMPSGGLVIFLTTPPATCIERLDRRTQWPVLMRSVPPENRLRQMERGHEVLHLAAEAMEAGGIQVVRSTGAGDGAVAAAEALFRGHD